MRLSRKARLVATVGAGALLGCVGCSRVRRPDETRVGQENAKAGLPTPAAFVQIPFDSIVRTLGPDVDRNGITADLAIGSITPPTGRYAWDYSLEFTEPQSDFDAVLAIASRLQELAARRHVHVTGTSYSGDASIASFAYETPSAIGSVSVVSLKRRRGNLDHFLVSVRENELRNR